jgi:hypothetical protein
MVLIQRSFDGRGKWHFIGELRVIVIGPFSLGQVSTITRGLVSTPGVAPKWEFGASDHSGLSPRLPKLRPEVARSEPERECPAAPGWTD